jgi:hypothetical protein
MKKHLLMNLVCCLYLVACPGVLIWMAYHLDKAPSESSRIFAARLNQVSPAE